MSSFSQRDGAVTITPDEGPSAGVPIEVVSHESDEFDTGYHTSYLKAAGLIVGIAEGTAEPNFKMDLCDPQESEAIRTAAHNTTTGQAYSCTITHVFRRTNVGTLSYRFLGAKMAKGGGYKADEGGVKSPGVEFMMKGASVSLNGGAFATII